MSGALIGFIIFVIVAIILVVWGVKIYNSLVRLRNTVDESFAQIAVQLQRRYDLIPNLLETVKGYAAHESETLKTVTLARTAAQTAVQTGSTADVALAEKAFDRAQVAINAVREAYPDLKASANFQQLQEELASTENKMAFARQNFNESVMEYNTQVQSFPSNVVASFGKFTTRDLFKIENEEVAKAPKISF
jgi:LemA protein